MRRLAFKYLKDWKMSGGRKPLIIQGARQVGKTYLVNEFGEQEFKHYVYLNFEEDKALESFFVDDFSPASIIQKLSLYKGQRIEAGETLLFFDEIQAAPAALNSLKYFREKGSAYYVIAAGSLLGVSVGKDVGFPVGMVNFLDLYPMTFYEFLMALGEEMLVEHLSEKEDLLSVPEAIHNKLSELLKLYLYVGGMPEVVKSYIEHGDVREVRWIQNEIIESYRKDFTKYADRNQSVRLLQFWNSIPGQIARERKKFKYKDIKPGGRSAHYELTLDWLTNSGLVNMVYNIVTPKLPLRAYWDLSKFKVYMNDVGLLGAELDIPSRLVVEEDLIFKEFYGAFIENYVAQELRAGGIKNLCYWTSRSDAEVDFLLRDDRELVPLEVKSGTSRNLKSLRSYANKYNPSRLYRLSPRNFVQSDDFVNLPLYAVQQLVRSLKRD